MLGSFTIDMYRLPNKHLLTIPFNPKQINRNNTYMSDQSQTLHTY